LNRLGTRVNKGLPQFFDEEDFDQITEIIKIEEDDTDLAILTLKITAVPVLANAAQIGVRQLLADLQGYNGPLDRLRFNSYTYEEWVADNLAYRTGRSLTNEPFVNVTSGIPQQVYGPPAYLASPPNRAPNGRFALSPSPPQPPSVEADVARNLRQLMENRFLLEQEEAFLAGVPAERWAILQEGYVRPAIDPNLVTPFNRPIPIETPYVPPQNYARVFTVQVGGESVRVWVNPTDDFLKSWFARAPRGAQTGTAPNLSAIILDGDMYVWHDAFHRQVLRHFSEAGASGSSLYVTLDAQGNVIAGGIRGAEQLYNSMLRTPSTSGVAALEPVIGGQLAVRPPEPFASGPLARGEMFDWTPAEFDSLPREVRNEIGWRWFMENATPAQTAELNARLAAAGHPPLPPSRAAMEAAFRANPLAYEDPIAWMIRVMRANLRRVGNATFVTLSNGSRVLLYSVFNARVGAFITVAAIEFVQLAAVSVGLDAVVGSDTPVGEAFRTLERARTAAWISLWNVIPDNRRNASSGRPTTVGGQYQGFVPGTGQLAGGRYGGGGQPYYVPGIGQLSPEVEAWIASGAPQQPSQPVAAAAQSEQIPQPSLLQIIRAVAAAERARKIRLRESQNPSRPSQPQSGDYLSRIGLFNGEAFGGSRGVAVASESGGGASAPAGGSGRQFWLYRGRDRNLQEQLLRDLLAIEERDALATSGKKTTTLSTRDLIFPPAVPGLPAAVATLIRTLTYNLLLVRDPGPGGGYHVLGE